MSLYVKCGFCWPAAAAEDEVHRHMWNITVTGCSSAVEPGSRCLLFSQDCILLWRTEISLWRPWLHVLLTTSSSSSFSFWPILTWCLWHHHFISFLLKCRVKASSWLTLIQLFTCKICSPGNESSKSATQTAINHILKRNPEETQCSLYEVRDEPSRIYGSYFIKLSWFLDTSESHVVRENKQIDVCFLLYAPTYVGICLCGLSMFVY